MDETTSMSPAQSPPQTASSSVWVWFAASIVCTTAISLAAAHAPPRIRLIGLFSIGYGLLIGWVTAQLAKKFEAHPSRRLAAGAAALLAFAGLIGSTWETVRLEEARAPKSEKELLAARLMEQMKAQSSDPADRPENRSPLLTSFRHYLSWRIRPLGEWSSPWPETFWCTELILAATASAWISARGTRNDSDQTSEPMAAST